MAGEEFLAWLASFQPHPRYWSLLYFLTIGSEPATIQHHPALHHLHRAIVLDRSTFVPVSYCCLALFPYRKGFRRSQILFTPVLPARALSPPTQHNNFFFAVSASISRNIHHAHSTGLSRQPHPLRRNFPLHFDSINSCHASVAHNHSCPLRWVAPRRPELR